MKQQDDWRLTDVVEHEIGRGDPFAAAIRGTRMPMVITDPRRDDNPIVFANKAFQDLTGYERDEIIGQNCRFLQDDGPGIPGAAHQGLGKTLIGRLSKQIGGKTLWLPADPGTRAVVDFPVSG